MLRLRVEREKRGLTRAALARKAAIGEGGYCTLESGKRQPWAPELERLAAALQWPGDPRELFEEIEPDASA